MPERSASGGFMDTFRLCAAGSGRCVPKSEYGHPMGERLRRSMEEESMVLCGANAYEQKYYLNPEFSGLPEQVKQELQILCVLFTEDVGGILILEFREDGTLTLNVTHADRDYLFDEIGSEWKIRQIQREHEELLVALERYFRVVFLGEDLEEDPEYAAEDAEEEP